MPKNKPNKGLLKRIRVTKSGRIKIRRSGGRHLRSHKSGKLLSSYRSDKFAHKSDAKRLASMLFIPARAVAVLKPVATDGDDKANKKKS